MKWIVTGGAGFIGVNAARRLMRDGHQVVVIDTLVRKGTSANLEWLRQQGPVEFHRCDIRDFPALSAVFEHHADADVVLHLAGQVAVTTSVVDPRSDFEINALGTFNVLEAARAHTPRAALLYASTNKVYGGMDDVEIVERDGRYAYATLPNGVPETRPLDFHSPYGCSKGTGDQYVIDYARIYGLRSVALRQSCIYGPRQFGVEDQGWVAWFTIAAALKRPITVYGDGKQVRDVLHVNDLVDCYYTAVREIDRCSGRAYNVGGGPANTMSLIELLSMLQEITGEPIARSYSDWRPGDQRVFVADISRAGEEICWRPTISAREGVRELHRWVSENTSVLVSVLGEGA